VVVVRTSIGNCSADGFDELSRKGEWNGFDEFPLMLDEDPPVMCGERGQRRYGGGGC
jgi:hypothetical protein